MTSSNLNFQKSKKMTQVNICQIICAKFHQNRHNRFGCRASTHRHTHTQTHTQTHTHTLIHTPSVSIATYSVKMTEYKKIRGSVCFSLCHYFNLWPVIAKLLRQLFQSIRPRNRRILARQSLSDKRHTSLMKVQLSKSSCLTQCSSLPSHVFPAISIVTGSNKICSMSSADSS